MFIELILSVTALVFITLLFFVRKLHLAYAKGQSIFLMKTDSKITYFWNWICRVYKESVDDVVELLKDTPHISLHFLNRIFYRLYKKTKKLVDLIKGNKIKKDGGSVSIYLRNIEKDN